MVSGFGFRVYGLGVNARGDDRVSGSGFEFRFSVQGFGFRVQGSEFRVQGLKERGVGGKME